ncbi:cyclic nucleotide-binding-like protein [Obelidium mucronatum]|nr:cyclic nucleotide-binding-like protein [Obelidium mucronatum]
MTQIRARARWHWAAQRILSLIKTTNMFKTNDKEEDNKKEKLKQLEEEVEAFESHGITASAIGFNMLQYKLSEKKSVLSLTNQMLQALSKETWARSKSDLGALEKLFNSLSVFAKYDPGVRKALSRVIRFSHFGPRRVIIKQGHPGQCFYIVAAGILEVKQSQILLPRVEDNNTQQNDASIIAHLHSGDSFGEVALLNDMKRNATVVSKTNTDLLWINREDFMVVLKEEAIRDIEEKQTFIASIPYFGQLPASSISQLASTAKFREVPPNTKIFSEGDCPGNVFIMCEGTSRLVKCVQFAEVNTYSHGNTHSLTPYPLRPDAHVEYGYKVVTRLLKIGDGGPGDFFGEEAAIANTGTPHQIIHLGSQGVNVDKFSKFQFSLISNTTVRYVLLNRHTFAREIILQPQLLNQAAMRVKALESGLINIPLIQEMYLNQIAWTKYKKTVSHQVKHQHLLKKSQIPTLPHLNTKIA